MLVTPSKLQPDNFTPPARTPWGGRHIRQTLKAGLALKPGPEVVGESWEVSVEPDFPSRMASSAQTLAETIAAAAADWLGPDVVARYGGQTPLLVKLLDSADNLSVQVHPHDGDPALGPGESGKPESWVVLDAEEGAGFYLGFKPGVNRAEVEDILNARADLSKALNFVPVQPGDAFVIAAGTPHAIGAGVTLVEPQFVNPGKRGLTYRFWDWNRFYDAQGRRTTRELGGNLRQLHVQRSLAVTDWTAPRGRAFVETCRAVPVQLEAGRTSLVDWPWFRVERWFGTHELGLPGGAFWALTVVAGSATVTSDRGTMTLNRGESGVVPAAVGMLKVALDAAEVIATTHAR